MGFFDKLKKITSNLFSSFSEADEEFFEELEETLILADLGMDTAVEAVEKLRKRVKKEGLRGQDEVREALREILMEEMTVSDAALDLSTSPSVVLFIGVNGVGKTTSIGKLGNQLKKEGKSILMISEEMPELMGMSDRLIIMKDGRIMKEFQRSKDLSDAEIIKYMI